MIDPPPQINTFNYIWQRWLGLLREEVRRIDTDGTSVASGVWVKISETTPTAISTVDMTWDESLYSAIKVDFEQLETDTDNDAMYMQLGSVDGATIHSTTSDYIGRYHVYQLGVSNLPETTQVRMITAWGNATGEGASGSMELWSYRGANNGAAFEIRTIAKNTAGASQRLLAQGVLTINSSVDTIRFLLGAGAFVATGTIRLYGLTI